MATQSDKQYDDTNRGSLFRNKRKNTEKHPDYTGSLNVDGKEYWLSAWSKFSPKMGENFLSCSITPKEASTATAGDDPLAPTKVGTSEGKPFNPTIQDASDLDGDVPF